MFCVVKHIRRISRLKNPGHNFYEFDDLKGINIISNF